MTATDSLLIALIFLLLGIAGAVHSVRRGLGTSWGWRLLWGAWIGIAGLVVLYSSLVVANP